MRCDTVIVKLDAYLAGELPHAIRVEVAVHVQGCVACRNALDQAQRLASLLSEIPTPPVPDCFTERVLARIKNQREQETPARSIRAWWLTLSAPMRAAAAAMLLLGTTAGVVLGWSTAPVPQNAALVQAEQTSDLFAGYGLDSLGYAPDGSLAEGYMDLLGGGNRK